jgi:hypothetical protein
MKVERRIRITSANNDILMEFYELNDRLQWLAHYHLWIDGEALVTVRIIALISAWMEHDDANFNHPLLTISEVE